MDLGLSGQRAVVTGASRGIGQAVALMLAKEGVHLALAATTRERVRPVAEACAREGVQASSFGVDVADFGAVQAWAKEVERELGPVDILVNNAGITCDGLLLRMSEEDFDRVLAVNLKGAFNTIRAFARGFLKRRGGCVINMASVVGLKGHAGQANYAASKGGLVALTRSLAQEFGPRGVRVNAVAPGLIDTAMTRDLAPEQRQEMQQAISLGRMGTPAEVAGAVLFLAGALGAYLTGQVIVVDGGLRI